VTALSFRSLRLTALVVLAAAFPALAAPGGDVTRPHDGFDRFIVRFKAGSVERGNAVARQRVLAAGAQAQRLHATFGPRMGIGADTVRLDARLDAAGAEAFMARLRRDPSVEYVEVDRLLKPTFTPNDPLYAANPANNNYQGQWHYWEATGGINLPAAWDLATGTGVVVAVIDTGVTVHTDMAANLVAGYDFIKDLDTANDGDGRDADPSDPGDWVIADECGTGEKAADSSWHGTHVSGTVAAVTNNASGSAGVAFNAKVMPLRVLGKCGGYSSDIADAITWAAGGSVPGVPANGNPAEVINLSLGGAGSCGTSTQLAINYAVSQKTVVVVASGNDNLDAAGFEPANCANVITVGATQRQGARSSFSNYGGTVDVSAPGGGKDLDGVATQYIYSHYNKGTTVPGAQGYAGYTGTSMAAPHVAGVVALMQSKFVSDPAVVESVLKSRARPLPVACPEGCGAGIVDAAASVAAVGAPPGPTPSISIGDASTVEGNSGAKNLAFTITLSSPAPAPVSFDAWTQPGTALPGGDYYEVIGNGITIPAGQSSGTFLVPVVGDTAVEGNETFAVELTNVVGATVGDLTAQGRIMNDDLAQLRVNDVAIYEGNSGLSTAVVEVTLSDAMPSPVTFNIGTASHSATSGSDFVAKSQTGRYIDAGRTRVVFEVAIIGDTTPEPHEDFFVIASGVSGALVADDTGLVTIFTDEAAAAPASATSATTIADGTASDGTSGDAPACRPAGQRRGRLEPILPPCAQSATGSASSR
jgi:serine protease